MSEFKCRVCGGEAYKSLFQWRIPLAADIKEKPGTYEKYPIEPVLCSSCGHVQLKETLELNMYDNYLYTPSFSKEFQEYVAYFADGIENMPNLCGGGQKRVIEIGSSNGYLLKQMQNRGWDVLGFEPSLALADAAEKDGVHTERMYFGSEDSMNCIEEWGVPDAVIMRHVMEHLDELNPVVSYISSILDKGVFIIEVPWLLKIIREKQFYAFFHEHLSYFSVTVLQTLLQKHGLDIFDLKENTLEGGSIAVYARKGSGTPEEKEKVSEYLRQEEEWCSAEKVMEFAAESNAQICKLRRLIEEEKRKGKKTAAWGAGQRGVTLLNVCGFSCTDIEYIVDVNRNYWWKYVSDGGIQIVPPDWVEDHFVDSILILATGYADEILSENRDYVEKGGEFIKII